MNMPLLYRAALRGVFGKRELYSRSGIVVHWDAQNDISRHLAGKFGFEAETEYSVYWLP